MSAVVSAILACCLLASWLPGAATSDVVVTTTWLYHHLSDVHIIEASWTLTEDQAKMEMIPGTALWDMRQCTMPTSTRPRNNPEELCLQIYARRLGIDKRTPIVIYDRTNMYAAARAWWTLSMLYGRDDVAVLDGGLAEWNRHNLPVEVGRYWQFFNESRGDWVSKYDKTHFRDLQQMVTDIRTARRQVIDTRLPQNYRGDEPEPNEKAIKALKEVDKMLCRRMLRGHMLSAVNIPWTSVVDAHSGRLLDCRQLRDVFQTAGVDLNQPLTTTCNLGNSACLVALASVHCGAKDVAVYSGSWTEWAQLGDNRLVVRRASESVHDGRCPQRWKSPTAAFMDFVFAENRQIAADCDS